MRLICGFENHDNDGENSLMLVLSKWNLLQLKKISQRARWSIFMYLKSLLVKSFNSNTIELSIWWSQICIVYASLFSHSCFLSFLAVEDFLVHDLNALEGFAGREYAPEKLKQVSYFHVVLMYFIFQTYAANITDFYLFVSETRVLSKFYL